MLIALVALVVVGTAPSIPVVLAGWCLTQIGINAGLTALIAVLPNRDPRGTAAAGSPASWA